MSKVTSKLQVTLPKTIAQSYQIRLGNDIEFEAAGDVIHILPTKAKRPRQKAMHQPPGVGLETNSMNVAHRFLIDTNILVYRYDGRHPEKKRSEIKKEVHRIEDQHVVNMSTGEKRGDCSPL